MADGGRVTLRATPPLYSSDSSFLFRGSKSHAVAKRSSFVPLHVPHDRTRTLNSQAFAHTSRFPIIRKWIRTLVTCQSRFAIYDFPSLVQGDGINFFSPIHSKISSDIGKIFSRSIKAPRFYPFFEASRRAGSLIAKLGATDLARNAF